MSIGTSMLPEFDQEMMVTRRLLERVPSEKGQWKPHAKSFALGHLAQLVSWMPGWVTMNIRTPGLDFAAGGFPGYTFETTETLLAGFDQGAREARTALAGVSDADLDVPWSLRRGEQIFSTMPRGAAVRQTISHLIHHRGQLTVYLRLNEQKVPAIYGPSADEGKS